MNLRRMLSPFLVIVAICVGILVTAGNRANEAWHYLLHGDDRITFESRHFVNPTSVPMESMKLIPTNEAYFGRQIYVSSPNDLKSLPAEIFIKKNGHVIAYSLSGGF